MMELNGKRAIVTGASSGIGAATARALERGRRARRARARGSDGNLDVTDAASCAAFVDEALEELGGLDILVNNAGLARGRDPVVGVDARRTSGGDRDERARADADDAALPADADATGAGTSSTSARSPGSGRTRTARRMSRRSSRCTATPVRCATICRASRCASRTSQPASSRRTSRRCASTATRRRRDAVYANVAMGGPLQPEDIADCIMFALTRPPHVNIDEIVVMALAQISGGNILREN